MLVWNYLLGAGCRAHVVTGVQTAEQKLRGGDAAPDSVALITGYDADAVAAVDAPGSRGLYRLAYILS